MIIRDLTYVVRSIWQEESNRGQRPRRLLFFVGWQLWKRIVGRPLKTKLFNGFRIEVWPDCDVSPAALYYVLPNSRYLHFLRRHLAGGTFLDIGASVGMVSLLVGDKVQHAMLFEPNPSAVERAKRNLELNKLRFEVFSQALSDTEGNVDFEDRGGTNSCNRTVDGFATSIPTIKVHRTTFDQFLREHRIDSPPITAVKIDVEGHELSVLRGMKEFLRNDRPKLVMFEYLQRTDIKKVLETFAQVGYLVFELSSFGPRVATVHVTPLQDLFACPDEQAEQFNISRASSTPSDSWHGSR